MTNYELNEIIHFNQSHVIRIPSLSRVEALCTHTPHSTILETGQDVLLFQPIRSNKDKMSCP